MPRWPTRPWAVLAVAVLGAGLGLGPAGAAPGDRGDSGGRLAPMSLPTSPARPLDAIVPLDVGWALLGRPNQTPDHFRTGLLGAVALGVLLLPALRAALGLRRGPARSAWLFPERYAVSLRAPPRPRLV
ncbi:MAG TPA: hypothetical protein VHH09_01420 [Acidimicrobiales bacterium]|nr:hypothetical protein [Acidimicrobiales bacterium]